MIFAKCLGITFSSTIKSSQVLAEIVLS